MKPHQANADVQAKRYVRANGRDILVSPEQVWA
jgi:hypothetical protein